MAGYRPNIFNITFSPRRMKNNAGAAASAGMDTSVPALRKYSGVKKPTVRVPNLLTKWLSFSIVLAGTIPRT